jgi:hypothetical protein
MIKDNIEINVKVNGVATPLHGISEETLLKIREASKPEPVPVFQVCNWEKNGIQPRLVFKVTERIANEVGKYVVLRPDGNLANSFEDMAKVDNYYINRRELRLEDV